MDNHSFIEVDTPALQNTASGATAKPFIAHHNALDMDVFLRISPELTLKKLVIGGFTNVYEIARDFRNEGMDANHLQDFTKLQETLEMKEWMQITYRILQCVKDIVLIGIMKII